LEHGIKYALMMHQRVLEFEKYSKRPSMKEFLVAMPPEKGATKMSKSTIYNWKKMPKQERLEEVDYSPMGTSFSTGIKMIVEAEVKTISEEIRKEEKYQVPIYEIVGQAIKQYREHLEAALVLSDMLETHGVERPWVRIKSLKSTEAYAGRMRLEVR